MFSEQELAYLQAQPLARIATVDNDGQPTVDVVDFQFDGARFYIGGHQLETTRKYKKTLTGQLTYLPVRGHPLTLKNMQMKKEIS